MFHIDAERIICTIWEKLRPEIKSPWDGGQKPGDPEPGLMTTLDLRMFHYENSCESEYKRSSLVHTLFTSNTSVFVVESAHYKRWYEIPVGDWKNTSNHDSCWRSDGMRHLTEICFRMADELNENLETDGFAKLAPRDFDQYCTLGFLANAPWEFVMVQHEQIPGEYHKRQVLSLRKRG